MASHDTGPRPEDLPWNDVAADDEVLPGSTEPDPAEVVGDETDARDLASRRVLDPNRRESIDERLAEEEPDRPVGRSPAPEAGSLLDRAEGGDEDVEPAEPDVEDPVEAAELPAEEAAVHVVDDDRVL
jgi:hypothetical protein